VENLFEDDEIVGDLPNEEGGLNAISFSCSRFKINLLLTSCCSDADSIYHCSSLCMVYICSYR